MKIIIYPLLVLFVVGCSLKPNSVEAELLSKSFTSGDCMVKDEWLSRDYDHKLDYANPEIKTDFFLLVYSNSPDFCAYKGTQGELDKYPFQCQSPNEFGWVIHGLWGESKSAYLSGDIKKHPRYCEGDLASLSLETIKPYLCMSPGTSLLQGEWEKHGACDFRSANEFFSKTKELFERFSLPPKELKAEAAMNWMKDNNAALEDQRLHLSGHEFGICFSTDFDVILCPKQ